MEKENKTYTREEGFRILNNASKEAFKIFNIMLDNDKLPNYYLVQLAQRNETLKNEVLKALYVFKTSLEREIISDRLERILIIFSTLLNIGLLLTVPLVGLATSLVYGYNIIKLINSKRKKIQEHPEKELDSVIDKENDIMNNIKNNEMMILRKTIKNLKENTLDAVGNPQKALLVMEANSIIQDYLETGIIPKNIDDAHKKAIINILQKDLNTDETDLETILKEAKIKVSEDTLIKKLEY